MQLGDVKADMDVGLHEGKSEIGIGFQPLYMLRSLAELFLESLLFIRKTTTLGP